MQKEYFYKINKIEAAGSQLDTAVELIFARMDDISASVLIHGSWSLIKDLCKHQGELTSRDMIANSLPNMPKADVWRILNEAWNFSKHAKNDPNSTIEISLNSILSSLLCAILDFSTLEKPSRIMLAYVFWYVAAHIDQYPDADLEMSKLTGKAKIMFPEIYSLDLEQKLSKGYDYAQSSGLLIRSSGSS